MSILLAGSDAVDLARLTGLHLHRNPAKRGDTPDTHWLVAERAIATGTPEDEFFIDLQDMPSCDSANAILSLIGLVKALP